jgi:hypothetical protein
MDRYNDPANLGHSLERRFDRLPLEGSAQSVPWTDTYWPKNKGGITHRWQTEDAYTYLSPTFEQLRAMSQAEIAKLSPSEKYDIYVGNYAYSLTTREKARNSPNETSWQGYCHGWTPASIHYTEPKPVTVVNPDGISIPFGSSDVKALLTLFQGEVIQASYYTVDQLPFKRDVKVVGSVAGTDDPSRPETADTNPGALHLILANLLGRERVAFGIDATTTAERWNQPVHRFRSTVIDRRPAVSEAAPGVVEELVVVSEVTSTVEIEPTWEAVGGTLEHRDTTKTYTYTLELNAGGEIVGGCWIIRFNDGSFWTLQQTVTYLRTLDRDSDGQPDLAEARVREIVWSYFDFPDCLWVHAKGEFSPVFQQSTSRYDFLANSKSVRERMYRYMAKLGDLYRASVN